MISYGKDIDLNIQIQNDIKKLELYKSSYVKKMDLYNKILRTETLASKDAIRQKVEEALNGISTQIPKIERANDILHKFADRGYFSKKEIVRYNKKYDEINQSFNENFEMQKEIMEDLTNVNTIKVESNDTLIISENLGKVIFPYNAIEILEIMKNEGYSNPEDVIKDKFTRKLSDFKFQSISRYKETIKLVKDRDGYSLEDAIMLAIEMMGKRYLHPAIIAACRTLDELDVYLDCLDKGEVEDFKIFNIKYELYPLVIKENSVLSKIKRLFDKKSRTSSQVDIISKK